MGMAHKFAQLQGGDRLVGRDETAETFRIHPAIAVRDRLQRDVVHARKPGRRAVQQARQLPAVTLRQVSPGRANLFFDQIEVVEQPFPGRRNPAVGLDRLCQQLADFQQEIFILGQPRQKSVPRTSRLQLVRTRKESCHAAPSDRR